MTIRIIGREQVVCDCTGNTSETYQDRLLVGISHSRDSIIVRVFCPECDATRDFTIRSGLHLDWMSH